MEWFLFQLFRTELIHREHPSSPMRSTAQQTSSEIFLAAVKRGAKRRARLSQKILAAGKIFSTPIASGNGEYLIDLSFGSPPQKASAIVDTGSDLIWVQCLPCQSCYTAIRAKFDPTKSSSYAAGLPYQSCNTSCQYNYMYGDDSSTSGALSFDSITIRTSTITNVAFGCGHRNLGTFAGAGGLMGLGQGPLSLISQAGAITSKIFSYCLVPLGINKTSPMYIGDSAAAGSDIAYTPLLNNIVNPSFYYVGLTGISVAGKAVNYPAGTFSIDTSGQGGFILDSGTTLTYLNTAAFTAVVAREAPRRPTLPWCFISLVWISPSLPLPPENIFVAVDTLGSDCLAMAASTGFSILGNIQQQNHWIVHGIVNKQVGFKTENIETI
ncbi:aspartic proteinase nepenthesin-2 isoform X2 [Physcomitrium patens]|uniref:aspartic proteinase nepenthesin-2 isoform X2 n=1 Tax=Physcomitrium patens TaxID=3218 RepID=UPI000D1597C5|nr:aspartic proteinase nepenthesin-2-like isoform X2 [Physcomitrium patens]|eukprot:XP_024360239.1 aspartic proteinase nepenthesin-2-like isoform X2 [Physcomitrella patens]